ncbi:hypothetical protein [Denitromonas ohlonensis]|jgi:uncharacterized membrane protein YozB (DUF420 family)|uniref:Uncharacterized protein n=2 Tax=Denitromonas TaxID=139331 RepID=A0A557SBF6_9RHOO|nr:hypothetical protein [Denitromonas ohlonensis]TVO68470.1 hypothetical protein FHP90_04115 [Denitromonas ohlonensis]TVO74748.1 hypothetical protein FHP89_15665 [Denitromonas ohlonensis]TVT71286.1 MAG: hypothetical protein FHP93_10590 [Denitromonas halophila]TVT72234.1 MAG: hypothetical protein FHP92_16045 [Denitromonas halophila]
MRRVPAPVAGVIAAIGGAVTGLVLLIGVLSITSATTEQHMLSVASAIVVLPVGLIVLAASVYVARRVYHTVRPPLYEEPPEDGTE